MLTKSDFSKVIQNTPLISIDLIIQNSDSNYLLGERVNKPAQGEWFVPGGRVFKDETLDEAFFRICKNEIGVELKREEVEFYGLYEHFYPNNLFNDDFSTHYVVLAHKFNIETKDIILNSQHSQYAWFSIDALLKNSKVNQYSKNYFLK